MYAAVGARFVFAIESVPTRFRGVRRAHSTVGAFSVVARLLVVESVTTRFCGVRWAYARLGPFGGRVFGVESLCFFRLLFRRVRSDGLFGVCGAHCPLAWRMLGVESGVTCAAS